MSLLNQSLSSLTECTEDTSDELPELKQASWVSSTVQAGDIILLCPSRFRARWPGLVDATKPRPGKERSRDTQAEVKRSARIRKIAPDMTADSAFSYEILSVHLLNFPDVSQAWRTLNPPFKVEFYSSDKQTAIYTEWGKTKHVEYVPHLIKAIEEAESYLRKRIARALTPGTPVQQYMQVKRSRLDFDFKGLDHTDQDKQLRVGDISTNDIESNNKSVSDLLACVSSPDPNSSQDRDSNPDLFDNSDPRPNLNNDQFKLLTERIENCREILRNIYLEKRHSVKHKAYFCSNREDKNSLHRDHLTSFDSLPYILDSGQKYEIHDIMVNFANQFVNRDPRKINFSVASYAYDVLLPECTSMLTIELGKNPLA